MRTAPGGVGAVGVAARHAIQHPDVFSTDHRRRHRDERAQLRRADEARDALPQHVRLPAGARSGRPGRHVLRAVSRLVRVDEFHRPVALFHRRLLPRGELPERRDARLLQLAHRLSHPRAARDGRQPVRRPPPLHRTPGAGRHPRPSGGHLHPARPPLGVQRGAAARWLGLLGGSVVGGGEDHRGDRRFRRRLRRRHRRVRPQHRAHLAALHQEDPLPRRHLPRFALLPPEAPHSYLARRRRRLHRVRDAEDHPPVRFQVRQANAVRPHRAQRLLRHIRRQPRVQLPRLHPLVASLSAHLAAYRRTSHVDGTGAAAAATARGAV